MASEELFKPEFKHSVDEDNLTLSTVCMVRTKELKRSIRWSDEEALNSELAAAMALNERNLRAVAQTMLASDSLYEGELVAGAKHKVIQLRLPFKKVLLLTSYQHCEYERAAYQFGWLEISAPVDLENRANFKHFRIEPLQRFKVGRRDARRARFITFAR